MDYQSNLNLNVNTSSLKAADKALKDTQNNVKKVKDESSGIFAKADKEVDNLTKSLKGLGTVTGTLFTVGLAAAAGAAALIIKNTMDAQREMASLRSVVQSTGAAAGFSADEINEMSDALSRTSILSGGEINEAAARMLTYTNIVGDQFPRAMQTAIDWSARYGVSVTQAAETLGKALDTPSKAAAALSKQGFKFSEDMVKQMQAFERAGEIGKAQALIFESIEEGTNGAAAALRDTFGGAVANLKNRLDDLMTGEGAGLVGATNAVNSFADALADPRTVSAASDLINLLGEMTDSAIGAVAALGPGESGFARVIDMVTGAIELGKANVEAFTLLLIQLGNSAHLTALQLANMVPGLDMSAQITSVKRDMAVAEQMIVETAQKTAGAWNKIWNGVQRPNAAAPAIPRGNGGRTVEGFGVDKAADRAAKERENALKRVNDLYNSTTASLREQIALYGIESEYAKTLYKTQSGNLKELAPLQKENILNLTQELEAKKALMDEIERENKARVEGAKTISDYDEQVLSNEKALEAIRGGQIRSQEQLTRFLEDESYWRGINKEIQEGSIALDAQQLETLKQRRAEMIEQGREFDRLMKYQTVALNDVLIDGAIGAVGSAFDSMFNGVSVSFGDLITDMAKQLAKSMLMNYLMNGLAGGGWGGSSFMAANSFTKQAKGGGWNNGVQFFAKGGIVNGATPFGMAGGGLGVMGEAGPEAIMPLTRGPDGKLGVQSSGSASIVVSPGAVVVNASNDSNADAQKTAMAIKHIVDTQIGAWMKNAGRPGGLNNQSFGAQRY